MNTHDDDTDPTGMRALLRGLPDPGPMPDDLVHRIQASLADLPPFEATSEHGDAASGDVSRGTTGATRPAWWIRHAGKAAIAAVVLIGGGAMASGQLGSFGSGDDASTSSAGSDTSDNQAKSYEESEPDSAVPRAAQGSAEAVPGGISIRQSDRAYRADELESQVSGATPGATLLPLTAETPSIGPIGTEIGVRSLP